MNAIIPNDNYDKHFVYYLLKLNLFQLKIFDSGTASGRENVSKSSFSNIKVAVPESKETQRKIATILSAYDGLIENNLKRIELCCEFANTNFKSLYVQQEGWQMLQLNDYTKYFGRGVTPQYKDGTGFYGINQKANKGLTLNKDVFKEYKIGDWVPSEKYAHKGDVLINSLGEGTIGRVHYYVDEESKYPVDQHMTIFRAKEKPFGLFIYQFFNSEFGQGHLHTLKRGGTNMTMLNVGDLRKIKLKAPNQNVLNEFHEVIQPLYDFKSKLETQNELLKEARDILLPRLMTGIIDVEQMNLETLQPTTA
jgi:type I restriction enzyme S subunit